MKADFLNKFQRTWVAAGAAVVSVGAGVYKGIKSSSDAKKAAKEKEGMQRPFEKVQDEYYQNKNISEQAATGGFSDATKNFVQQQNDRGISAGVSALKEGGGDMNMVSRLFDNYSEKISGFASADSEQHMKNLQYFQEQNKNIAGQKTIQYGVNELQPYENKLKELSGRIVADKQNAANGWDQAIGSAASIGTTLSNKSWGKATSPTGNDAPFYTPSSMVGPISSTGVDADTSKALAKYLTRTGGSIDTGDVAARAQDEFSGN